MSSFSVKANNDAHIGFFENDDAANVGDAGDFAGTSHGPQYEIVLSGWGGTQSVIREAAQGENHAVTDTTGYLNPNDFRQFWASAANGLLRIGAGNIVGFNVFMQWQDPNDFLDVTKAAVATGWGNEGDWVVCIPEQCSGWFDATVATLSAEPGSTSTGPVLCTEENGGAGAGGGFGTVDAGGCDGRQGSHNGGYVDYQAAQGDRVTFDLSGCDAGAALRRAAACHHEAERIFRLAGDWESGMRQRLLGRRAAAKADEQEKAAVDAYDCIDLLKG